jgi:hypothetical protein
VGPLPRAAVSRLSFLFWPWRMVVQIKSRFPRGVGTIDVMCI